VSAGVPAGDGASGTQSAVGEGHTLGVDVASGVGDAALGVGELGASSDTAGVASGLNTGVPAGEEVGEGVGAFSGDPAQPTS
jgi:hypothetical protein